MGKAYQEFYAEGQEGYEILDQELDHLFKAIGLQVEKNGSFHDGIVIPEQTKTQLEGQGITFESSTLELLTNYYAIEKQLKTQTKLEAYSLQRIEMHAYVPMTLAFKQQDYAKAIDAFLKIRQYLISLNIPPEWSVVNNDDYGKPHIFYTKDRLSLYYLKWSILPCLTLEEQYYIIDLLGNSASQQQKNWLKGQIERYYTEHQLPLDRKNSTIDHAESLVNSLGPLHSKSFFEKAELTLSLIVSDPTLWNARTETVALNLQKAISNFKDNSVAGKLIEACLQFAFAIYYYSKNSEKSLKHGAEAQKLFTKLLIDPNARDHLKYFKPLHQQFESDLSRSNNNGYVLSSLIPGWRFNPNDMQALNGDEPTERIITRALLAINLQLNNQNLLESEKEQLLQEKKNLLAQYKNLVENSKKMYETAQLLDLAKNSGMNNIDTGKLLSLSQQHTVFGGTSFQIHLREEKDSKDESRLLEKILELPFGTIQKIVYKETFNEYEIYIPISSSYAEKAISNLKNWLKPHIDHFIRHFFFDYIELKQDVPQKYNAAIEEIKCSDDKALRVAASKGELYKIRGILHLHPEWVNNKSPELQKTALHLKMK